MDTSSLIDLNLGHKENTDRLYYDQYRYSLKLRMKDFSCLREIRNQNASLESASLVVSKRFEQRLNYSRFYSRNGNYYPSVTNILQFMPKNKYFENWLKDVGHNADIIARRAAEEGTQVHDAAERYLKGEKL